MSRSGEMELVLELLFTKWSEGTPLFYSLRER
jgi:hypothetical protein